MPTLALVGPYGNDVVPLFKKKLPDGFDIIQISSESEFSRLAEVDYIVLRVLALNAETIRSLAKAKLIQRWGVGFDKVDVKEAGLRGIQVAIAPGGNASPVSELVILLILALYRKLIPLRDSVALGNWDKQRFIDDSFMLRGKRVGLVGCGAIGAQVAEKARAFGAEVAYFDVRRLPEEMEMRLGVRWLPLEELLSSSDIISLHIPLTDATRGFLGKERLALMRRNSILINTSRGEIVDTSALLQALRNGELAGAGLDVVDPEPLPKDHPILTLGNVIVTPHVGGNTADLSIDMVDLCSRNILDVEEGKPLSEKVLVNGQYLASRR